MRLPIMEIFNVSAMPNPVIRDGLTGLMDYFNVKGVAVALRCAVLTQKDGSSCTVSLTICDSEVRPGFTDYAKDVHFSLALRAEDGRMAVRGIVDIGPCNRAVKNLLDPSECGTFAEALLQQMAHGAMVAAVPELKR